MRNTVSWFLFWVTCILGVWFGLRQFALPSGGGAYEVSPDGQYFAEAMSYQNYPLSKEQRIYASFVIRKKSSTGTIVTSVKVVPERVSGPFAFREDENLKIEWSKDSSRVTFTTPNETLQLRVPAD